MRPEDYNEEDVQRMYDTALSRKNVERENRYTLEMLQRDASRLGYAPQVQTNNAGDAQIEHLTGSFDLDHFTPRYYQDGLKPRDFVGPWIGRTQLFPIGALSLLVALGGAGKTSLAIAIGCHVAAGKDWGTQPVQKRNVLYFSVEEDQLELDRKFGATVEHWSQREQQAAINGLRLISLKGDDPRLTKPDGKGRYLVPSDLSTRITKAAREFSAELIFLDHLQGLTSGDLNNSDTATILSQVANEIVSETGSAVVFAAHTTKSKITAQEVEHGFTTGSLAFENAARQVTGIIRMPADDAVRLNLVGFEQQYRKLEISKNSYGTAGETSYLKTELSTKFNTVSIKPYIPPIGSMAFESKEEALRRKVRDYIKEHPYISKKQLDDVSGKRKAPFRASKADVRRACDELIDAGLVEHRAPKAVERNLHKISVQSRKVLVCVE